MDKLMKEIASFTYSLVKISSDIFLVAIVVWAIIALYKG